MVSSFEKQLLKIKNVIGSRINMITITNKEINKE